MTPNLKAAITAIQTLSPVERQQLLQILNQDNVNPDPQADFVTLSAQFWQGVTLKQLFTNQTPKTVFNLKDLAVDFWPDEDSIENFLAFLKQQRQEAI
ncbi:MAG: hypothetical protein WA865_08295 [Spirulinaceae cyanobacterium]